jgi:hypothetical protein
MLVKGPVDLFSTTLKIMPLVTMMVQLCCEGGRVTEMIFPSSSARSEHVELMDRRNDSQIWMPGVSTFIVDTGRK